MTKTEIEKIMIKKVEEIVRNKVRDDFKSAKPGDRKNVAKLIINELERVINDEN